MKNDVPPSKTRSIRSNGAKSAHAASGGAVDTRGPHKLPAALKAAFPHTIPVMASFIFVGMAFGILLSSKGYGPLWVVLFSAVVFAGSLQFVGVGLLVSTFNPLHALLMALVVNARHLFYGLAMLERFQGTGKYKPYLIFGLCDETFSLLCSVEPPQQVDKNLFMFCLTAMNQSYWLLGSLAGGLIGPMLTFNTRGIDFVMTAFFVVVFVNQWRATKNHAPALTGLGASLLCLLIFGAEHFIIPAMLLIVLTLSLLPKTIDKEGGYA